MQAVGITRARDLSYTARNFSGIEAAAWGMAVKAVPRSNLDAEVAALCAAISQNSRGSLAAYKDLYRAAQDHGLSGGLSYEEGTGYPIPDTEDRVAGFR